ncbi:shikimate dehydrogenase [Candidatus Woesearchaeota archaeon]|jgi:3-dehydroquinate dehydratase / shikimate dehydrogenase|nr:shikimate dehydrogenase [Candidatus Woesearchaeota archaeon]
MKKNIVLIGYRATGKSSVARELSIKLNIPMISTDETIVKQIGSIAEFVKELGWKSFRDVEFDVIKNISVINNKGKACIVDCGGGVVENKDNIKHLRKNSIIFLLDASPEIIIDRLGLNGSRPTLTGLGTKKEVQEVLSRRQPLYEEAADFIINTANGDIKDIAAEIKLVVDMLEEKISHQKNILHNLKIAAVVAEDNLNDTLKMLKKSENVAEIVEVRIDHIKNISENDVKIIIENKKNNQKIIITNRRISEGGLFQGTEDERINLLKTAIDVNADFVDIELSSGIDVVKNIITLVKEKNSNANTTDNKTKQDKTKIICSFHDFKKLPDNINDVLEEIKSTDADIIKIACMGNSAVDNIIMFNLIEKTKSMNNGDKQKEMIGIVMGRHGKISRALSGIFGGFISTFVPVCKDIDNKTSVPSENQSAPGQISIEQIKEIQQRLVFQKVCLLIGDPVAHSMSSIMHNAAFEKVGLDIVYETKCVKADELKNTVKNLRSSNITGFNITIPHKQNIINELDEIDSVAKQIGAVNSVLNENGKLKGFNTDWLGALKAIEEKLESEGNNLKDMKVVLVGAGGAGRAITYAMSSVGIKGDNLIIMSKKKEDADKLADEFNGKSVDISELNNIKADLLINATPVGMHPNINDTITTSNTLKNFKIVFDIVYNPLKTRLLREAEEAGCKTIDGLKMLVHQGAAAFELWIGEKPDVDLMYDVVKKELMINKNQ